MSAAIKNKITERFEKSERLKLYRKTSGLKQFEAASMVGICQCEYSKKENGWTLLRDEQVEIIRKHFIEWRKEEIKRLEARIKELQGIE